MFAIVLAALDRSGSVLPILYAMGVHELAHVVMMLACGGRVRRLTLRFADLRIDAAGLGYLQELLAALNARPMKGYGGLSRRDLFERYDRPALQPVPAEPFVYGDWLRARVNIDYHVEVDHHYYSVPYALIHAALDIRLTAQTVEIFQGGTRVWLHARSHQHGRHTTVPAHMPKSHQAHLEWTPSRLRRWGATIGPATEGLITQILESRPHPEQGYRSCLGLLRLTKQYGPARLERACDRARAAGAKSYRHVDTILKHGLDRHPLAQAPTPARLPLHHDNVRGPAYYQDGDPS